MTGRQVFDSALKLVGYNDDFGESFPAVIRRCEPIINAVYNDICSACGIEAKPLCSMDDEIELEGRIVDDCMVYGAAMMAAEGENDSDNQRFFARLYEYKRSEYSKRSSGSLIDDIMP